MDRALQVKALIWTQSLLAICLFAGFLWAMEGKDAWLAAAFSGCGILWFASLAPVFMKARSLPLHPAKGLPGWFLALVALAQFLQPAFWHDFDSPKQSLALNGAAWLLIALRWVISLCMDVPVHRRTWGILLTILTVGAAWQAVLWMWAEAWASC